EAPLSFLNAYLFRRDVLAILRKAREPVEFVVLEASAIPEIDFTAAQALKNLISHARRSILLFAIARLKSLRGQKAIKRFGGRSSDPAARFIASAKRSGRSGVKAAPPSPTF